MWAVGITGAHMHEICGLSCCIAIVIVLIIIVGFCLHMNIERRLGKIEGELHAAGCTCPRCLPMGHPYTAHG